MDGLGVLMAFLLFWLLMGVGLVASLIGARGLIPKDTRITLIANAPVDGGSAVIHELASKILLAVGMLLIYIGGSSAYNVMFR